MIVVGLVDDKESTDGGIEILDSKSGKSIYRKNEKGMLCSIEGVKLR